MVNRNDVKIDYSIPSVERIIKGIEIIRRYSNETYLAAEHDVIYFGAYDETIEQMTEDEQRLMFSYGWHEETDSWAFYV